MSAEGMTHIDGGLIRRALRDVHLSEKSSTNPKGYGRAQAAAHAVANHGLNSKEVDILLNGLSINPNEKSAILAHAKKLRFDHSPQKASATKKGSPKGWPAFDPEGFDLRTEMREGYVISDAFGSSYNVSVGEKCLYRGSWDEALCYIANKMKTDNFFCNVFYASVLGNVDLLALQPKSAWRCESRIVHSWV